MFLYFLEVLLFHPHFLFCQELLVHLIHLLAGLQRLKLHHLNIKVEELRVISLGGRVEQLFYVIKTQLKACKMTPLGGHLFLFRCVFMA